jgi:hypothetical protein
VSPTIILCQSPEFFYLLTLIRITAPASSDIDAAQLPPLRWIAKIRLQYCLFQTCFCILRSQQQSGRLILQDCVLYGYLANHRPSHHSLTQTSQTMMAAALNSCLFINSNWPANPQPSGMTLTIAHCSLFLGSTSLLLSGASSAPPLHQAER